MTKNVMLLPEEEAEKRLNLLSLRDRDIKSILESAPDAESHAKILIDHLRGNELELGKIFSTDNPDFLARMKSAGRMVLWDYLTLPKEKLSSVVTDKTLTELYTGQGMFALFVNDISIRINPPVPEVLAPLYRIILSDPQSYTRWRSPVMRAVALLVLENGAGLTTFLDGLKELEQAGRGPVYVDLLQDLANDVIKLNAPFIPIEIEQAGGVPALIRNKVNLLEIYTVFQEDIKINCHSPKSFPAMYSISRDILDHLAGDPNIHEDELRHYREAFAENTLVELKRSESEGEIDKVFWSGVLTEIGPHLEADTLTFRKIILFAKYAESTNKIFEANLAANFIPEHFKIKIVDYFLEADRYEVIKKLRAETLYSTAEILSIRGYKFHTELGL